MNEPWFELDMDGEKWWIATNNNWKPNAYLYESDIVCYIIMPDSNGYSSYYRLFTYYNDDTNSLTGLYNRYMSVVNILPFATDYSSMHEDDIVINNCENRYRVHCKDFMKILVRSY